MSIREKAMLASVHVSMWSARKIDRKVTAETNRAHGAVADAGRYNKQLLATDALAEITSLGQEAYRILRDSTLPWGDNGDRILSVAMADKYETAIREIDWKFHDAVDRFCAAYPAFVDAARARLNGMFNDSDYPPEWKIKRKFRFKRRLRAISDDSDFRVDLSAADAARIKAEIKADFDLDVAMALREAYQRIAGRVSTLVEKLNAYQPAAGDTGAANVFRDSTVDLLRDLVETLPALNFCGDSTLTKITDRLAQVVKNSADTLRENADLRKSTATEAQAILDDISEFLA